MTEETRSIIGAIIILAIRETIKNTTLINKLININTPFYKTSSVITSGTLTVPTIASPVVIDFEMEIINLI